MPREVNIVSIHETFPTEAACIAHLENVRWPFKPVCPYCKSIRTTAAQAEQRHHCNNCNTGFSVTVQTIFHHTHLPLQKWFLALSLVLNAKKGISVRKLSRDLEVNKNTACRMAMQIRKALAEPEQRPLLIGVAEMDETNMSDQPWKSRDKDDPPRRGRAKKVPVVGTLERSGKVRTQVVRRANSR